MLDVRQLLMQGTYPNITEFLQNPQLIFSDRSYNRKSFSLNLEKI